MDQLNVDLDALQALSNFTENSQQEQHDHNQAHSARNMDYCQSGLAGATQTAAFTVGQERDAHWNSNLLPKLQALVDNNRMATAAYHSGEAEISGVMAQHSYGYDAVINKLG